MKKRNNWAENIDKDEDTKREKGLNKHLEQYEEKLKDTKDLSERKKLLIRIIHILDELKTESFDYDKEKMGRYIIEYKNIKAKIRRNEDKKREEGLRKALLRNEKLLEETKFTDYKRQNILLNRINHIYSEIEQEGIFHYPEIRKKYIEEQKKVEKLIEKRKEMDSEIEKMKQHNQKDISREEYRKEEEEFER